MKIWDSVYLYVTYCFRCFSPFCLKILWKRGKTQKNIFWPASELLSTHLLVKIYNRIQYVFLLIISERNWKRDLLELPPGHLCHLLPWDNLTRLEVCIQLHRDPREGHLAHPAHCLPYHRIHLCVPGQSRLCLAHNFDEHGLTVDLFRQSVLSCHHCM